MLKDVCAIYSGIEAAVNIFTDRYYPKLFDSYPKLAISAEKTQKAMNVLSVFVGLAKAFDNTLFLTKNIRVLNNLQPLPLTPLYICVPTFLVATAAGVISTVQINEYFSKDKKIYGHPSSDLFQEAVLIARIVFGVTGLFIGGFSPLILLSLALESATLINTAKRCWVHYNINCAFGNNKLFKWVDLNFYIRVHQANLRENDNCGICQSNESSDDSTILSCKKHVYHLKCILPWHGGQIENMFRSIRNNGVNILGNQKHRYIDLKKDILPNCPTCRSLLIYEFNGILKTHAGSIVPLTVNIV